MTEPHAKPRTEPTVSPRFEVEELGAGSRELDAYDRDGYEALGELWTRSNWQHRLSYEVSWLGIPIIQLPEDVLMMQELIWNLRPDVVIEAGVAHGGALILYSSLLELLGKGKVIGIDVEIRAHNRTAIEAHPMSGRIELIEGDSLAAETVSAVKELIGPDDRVLVALDSNHTKEHVLGELERYGPLVTPGSYLVVFDGVMPLVADAPNGSPDWEHDNPLAAVREYMTAHDEFELDPLYNRLGVTYCPEGFWRRREGS